MPVEDTGNQRGTARALSGDFSPGAPEEHLRRPLSRCRGRRCSALTHVTMVAGPDTPSARDVTVLALSSHIVTIGRDITIPPDTGTSDLAGQHLTT